MFTEDPLLIHNRDVALELVKRKMAMASGGAGDIEHGAESSEGKVTWFPQQPTVPSKTNPGWSNVPDTSPRPPCLQCKAGVPHYHGAIKVVPDPRLAKRPTQFKKYNTVYNAKKFKKKVRG